jgi:hypothetical protein
MCNGIAAGDKQASSEAHAAQTTGQLRMEWPQSDFGSRKPSMSQHPSQIANPQRFQLVQNFPSGPADDRRSRTLKPSVSRRSAEELYRATSRDAETFQAALLIPEIRLKLERALHQKLPDQLLIRLASQAKMEALYWYRYMQILDRAPSTVEPNQ